MLRRRVTSGPTGIDVGLALAMAAVVVPLVLLTTRRPEAVVLVPVLVALVAVAVKRPQLVSSLLLVVGLLFLRPFIGGERYSPLGAALVITAGFVAVLDDRGRIRMSSSSRTGVIFVALAWAWGLLLAAMHAHTSAGDTWRSIVTVAVTTLCAAVVLRVPERRLFVAKALIWTALALCASAAVTAAIWSVKGVGTLNLGTAPVGYDTNSIGQPLAGVPIYFPFTPTYSTTVLGISRIPRLLGYGQEAGVFAAMLGVLYFMLDRVGMGRVRWKVLIVFGIAVTASTGGFGAFLVAWVIARFIVTKVRARTLLGGYARVIFGLAALGGAMYLAIVSPVLGVAAKLTVNATSVDDRASATALGLHAAITHVFGLDLFGDSAVNAGINVIASMAQVGAIGAALALAAVVLPWLLSDVRRPAAGAILVLLVTVLTAQPLVSSPGFFVLALLATASLPGDLVRDDDHDPGGAVAASTRGVAVPARTATAAATTVRASGSARATGARR